jgi:hypothetical protein
MIVGQKLPMKVESNIPVAKCEGIEVAYDPVAYTTTLTWHDMPPGSVIIFKSAVEGAIQEHVDEMKELVAQMSDLSTLRADENGARVVSPRLADSFNLISPAFRLQ